MKRLLIITQCFPCGSWLCIEKIIEKMVVAGYKVTVLGLGVSRRKNIKFKYYCIPYPDYNNWGNIVSRSPLTNFLWNFPLNIIGALLMLVKRPDAVAINGLATGLTMAPFIRLMRSKTIIMYHSVIGDSGDRMRKLLHFLGKFVDMVVVNSLGSYRDISPIVNVEKIIINEHYADDLFFKTGNQTAKNGGILVVSYVGRIDEDKHCFPLMEAIKILNGDKRFQFNFAGAGSGLSKVELLAKEFTNVKYLGYINKREELKKVYEGSDVLWTFADETYLGMPAVEALACGTPIIVPIYAAIQGSRKRIERDLVPNSVGWFIDSDNVKEIVTLLTQIQQNGIPSTMKESCVTLAKERYSKNNVENAVSKIITLLNKNVR